MKILIIYPILYSVEGYKIPKVKSIKDTIFYSMCLGFKNCDLQVTLLAAEDYKPVCEENFEFEIVFFKTQLKHILPLALPLLKIVQFG